MPRPREPGGELDVPQGLNWTEYLHPEDRDRTLRRWRHSMETGDSYDVEYRFREAATGKHRWFIGRALPHRDASGRIVRWFGTSTDIEAQVQSAEYDRYLQRSASRLAAAATPREVAAVVAGTGCEALGAKAGSVSTLMPDGENLELLFVYGDSPPDVTAEWRTFPLAAPLPVSEAVRTRRPVALLTPEALRESAPAPGDTVERARISAGIAYPLLQGELAIGAIGFTFGTPEHLTAEQERFLAQLAQQCADALERARLVEAERVAQEHTRRLLALSDALAGSGSPASAAEIAARHALEGLGAQTASVFLADGDGAQQIVASHGIPREMAEEHGRVPAEMDTPVTDSARTGTAVLLASPRESRVRYPALVDVWESAGIRSVAVFPLMRPGNEGTPVIGSLGVSFSEPRDLSADDRAFVRMVAQQAAQAIERGRLLEAEREARAHAEEASRAKSEFLASMSHELRTPLNAIGGYVDLISMGIRGPVTDTQRHDLDRVNAAQRHLLGLINSVLDFSKAEAGRVDFHIEALPVDELLGAVEPLVGPQLRAKAQRFTSEPSGSTARVRADREKVAQILLNLVSNAIKFTPAGGSITLAAEPRGEEVAIRVSDTGRGLPADKLEAVFEPFVQVDNRLTEGHGTGLGLAISRELARGMKGELTVTSEPGVGSVFTLMLPGA